jgi:predicted nucleic acid-binding protein
LACQPKLAADVRRSRRRAKVGGGRGIRITRPEHLAAAQISTADVEVLLDAIARIVEPIRTSYLWRPVPSDPGDDLVLETAVNGRADVVVTFNRRHFGPAAAPFGLEILAPADAVRRLEDRA